MKRPVARKQWIKRLAVAAVIAVLAAAAEAGAILYDGIHDHLARCDVAIVLGNRVDGDRPSPWLRARLERAVNLYQRGYFPWIIVSGGDKSPQHDEPRVMRDYLISRGVPAGAVIMDRGGINTWATAQDSVAIMQRMGLHSAMAITQHYHIPRTRLAFKRWGISPVYTAHAYFWSLRDIRSTLREMAGYPYYALRRKG